MSSMYSDNFWERYDDDQIAEKIVGDYLYDKKSKKNHPAEVRTAYERIRVGFTSWMKWQSRYLAMKATTNGLTQTIEYLRADLARVHGINKDLRKQIVQIEQKYAESKDMNVFGYVDVGTDPGQYWFRPDASSDKSWRWTKFANVAERVIVYKPSPRTFGPNKTKAMKLVESFEQNGIINAYIRMNFLGERGYFVLDADKEYKDSLIKRYDLDE